MTAYLLPALEAFARFMPDLPRGHAEARMHHVASAEAAMALVIEGDAVSGSTGVIRTVDFVRDVAPPVAEDTVPAAIFVTGDVIAPDAILEEFDSDWSPTLKVLGSVMVRSLFLYGSASEIDGDLIATDAVFGFYNHGSLRVGGAVRAMVLLDSDYTWEVVGPVVCRYVLGDLFRANFKRSHPAKDLTRILVWDAVTDEDGLDHGFIWSALSRGDPILRPADVIGTKPKPQLGTVARERLAALHERRAAGEAVTELDLSGCQLRFVPEDLRSFTALLRLSLGDNRIGTLPPWLVELNALESLDLQRCGLRQVPSDLDRLPALRELDLSQNDIAKGPKRSGPLARLEHLTIGSPYCFGKRAPAVHGFTASLDLGGFPRLRVVDQQFGGGVELHYTAAHRLWASPTLEYLRLDLQTPMTLPEHLAEATGLRVLGVNLDGGSAVASAAVLSRMPGLRLLYLDIFSQLTRDQFDVLCAAVPNAYVRHWCATPTLTAEARERYDAADRRREIGEPGRIAQVDACLADMDVAQCFERCEHVERLIAIKTVELLWSVLDADVPLRPDALRAAADWGDRLSAQVPDLGEYLWRFPLTELGSARALATLCAAMRPMLEGDRDGALRAIDAVEVETVRDTLAAPAFRRDGLKVWLDKARTALSQAV